MDSKKILIVDDSKLIHKMFEVMLRPHRLVHAEDGIDGIQKLAEHADVELVLLDINMPRMNGLEFLGEVKKDEALSTIPVVVVSTEGKDEDTERARDLGGLGVHHQAIPERANPRDRVAADQGRSGLVAATDARSAETEASGLDSLVAELQVTLEPRRQAAGAIYKNECRGSQRSSRTPAIRSIA